MVSIKLVLAFLSLCIQEAAQFISRILLSKGRNELRYYRFRSGVKRALTAPLDSNETDSLGRALRALKQDLVKLEAVYDELLAVIPKDLMDCEHLRYCDERQQISAAQKETERFIAKLLLIVQDALLCSSPVSSRLDICRRLKVIWRLWYCDELPIEIYTLLANSDRHFESSERALNRRYPSAVDSDEEESD